MHTVELMCESYTEKYPKIKEIYKSDTTGVSWFREFFLQIITVVKIIVMKPGWRTSINQSWYLNLHFFSNTVQRATPVSWYVLIKTNKGFMRRTIFSHGRKQQLTRGHGTKRNQGLLFPKSRINIMDFFPFIIKILRWRKRRALFLM